MNILKGLDDDVGGVMGAANAANDLGQQLKGALARGKVRQCQPGVGLDDTDSA